jgi:hypothetical protein
LAGPQPTACTASGGIEVALRRAGKGYVLGVKATHYFGSRFYSLRRLSTGLGMKGERLHDWA